MPLPVVLHPAAPMTLLEQVATTLRRRIRAPRGARVLAAVSGGADSVALAWLLAALAERGTIELAGIAHLNHQLRGAEADADEAFCQALAQRIGVPCRSTRADVARLAASGRESIEAAARRARYAWLAEARRDLDADFIATGHTLDDQAETVLLRLLRGAGTRGLSGIRVVRGAIIRPLLDCRRRDVRAFLVAGQQTFREDASNADVTIPRNRLRHELLPVIDRLAPGGLDALARTAALAVDDEEFLLSQAIIAARSVVLTTAAGVQLNREPLHALAPAIGRRVIRAAAELAAPLDALRLTSAHIEAVWRLVGSERDHIVELPGVRAEAVGEWVRLAPSSDARGRTKDFEMRLDLPGTVTVAGTGWRISADVRDQSAWSGVEVSRGRQSLQIVVPVAMVGQSVTVRSRRPGDRIKPIGAPGRKKLQDLLVDLKVPRGERDQVPVVVNQNGQVVWVVGVAMADEFRVTAPEAEVVVFTAERQ